jgi:hypothetical protein
VAQPLREAGFSEAQAEAVAGVVQEGAEGADFATKGDLAVLSAELRAEIAAVRSEMREMEQRLIARIESVEQRVNARIESVEQRLIARIESVKAGIETAIEAAKSDMLGRMFQMVLGAVLVNFVAMLGVMFAFAKLLGH